MFPCLHKQFLIPSVRQVVTEGVFILHTYLHTVVKTNIMLFLFTFLFHQINSQVETVVYDSYTGIEKMVFIQHIKAKPYLVVA